MIIVGLNSKDSNNNFLIYLPAFLTLVSIIAIVYFINKSQYKSDVNELEKIKLKTNLSLKVKNLLLTEIFLPIEHFNIKIS